jgi:2,3-bisphosphoglycerate-dependent phosphoglycerate mutase
MTYAVLLRHGESQWNLENRFTGWTDVDLSPRGAAEARAAGRALQAGGYDFDLACTSFLKRAIRTLWLVQEEMDRMWWPVQTDWRLNERHYGALQGLNKAEMTERHGAGQVKIWRRSYDVRPPALEENDTRHPRHDPRYQHLAAPPATESLADTLARALPYWNERVLPLLQAGQRPLIVAHGNSLRALVKHLDGLSNAQVMELNIPTGVPLVYEFDAALRPVGRRYLDTQPFLG